MDDKRFRIPPDWFQNLDIAYPMSEELPASAWHITPAIKSLHARGIDGRGVKVAVNDTAGQADHPFLPKQIAGKDFTSSQYGLRDTHGHGCVAPWDKVITSLCGLQTAEYLFDNAPGISHKINGATIKDVSRYDVFTSSADPKTGKPIRAKVMAVHKLHHHGKVFRVETHTGVLTLTPWHPVYVVRSATGTKQRIHKVRADCLKVGDKILAAGEVSVGQVVVMPYRKRFVCIH